MFLVIIIVPITIWYIKNNEKTNLIKSSAFIERDGIIYYIRLGYTLDYQQSTKWGCEILSNGGLSIRKRNEAMGMVIVL